MKWRIVSIILLICLLLPAGAAAQAADSPLIIPTGETYEGNFATATRAIRVEGVVTGDVTSWSGDIEVAGRVDGDVVSYSGKVTVKGGGQIGGHILALGGALRVDTHAVVAGQAIQGGEDSAALANLLDLFAPAGADAENGAVGRVLFGMVLGVFLLAFCLLCIAFWPQRTAATSLTLRRSPGQALLLGLLSTLLLALAQAPYVLGLATLARAVGLAPGRAGAGPERTTLLVGAALAVLVAISAALAPLWGLVLFYLLASPGLGAALLSRGGLLVPVSSST